MKASTLWVSVVVVIILVAGYFYFSSGVDSTAFADCITASGAKMYGAWWCPHCSDQKAQFGGSWNSIDYIECSNPDRSQNEACTTAGIMSYPTWEFGDGRRLEGVLSFSDLSRITGCALP